MNDDLNNLATTVYVHSKVRPQRRCTCTAKSDLNDSVRPH